MMASMEAADLTAIPGGDDSSSEVDAAKDVLKAVKAGDASALSLALTRHYEACSGQDKAEPDADDEA